MTTLLVIVWAALVALFVLLLAVRPKRTHRSRFELKRLADTQVLRRERLLGGFFSLRRIGILLVFGIVAMLGVIIFGSWVSLAVLLVALTGVILARNQFIAGFTLRIYSSYEPTILHFIEKNPWLGIFMLPSDRVPRDQHLESIEHLLHLSESSSFLSQEQLSIVKRGLSWHKTTVGSIMVPRKQIVSVKHTELLGPLVLDDLHKTGHSQFPVIHKSLDNVVGLLDITELLEVTAKQTSQKVQDSMSARVVYVPQDEPLPQALALLQKSKQHMLLVTGGNGETVGLITLADITGSLLGKTGVE